MADQTEFDMVMTFTPKSGDFLAECQLAFDPKDPLMKGIFRAADDSSAGNYFEITSFDFGIELVEDDKSQQKVAQLGSAVPAPRPAGAAIKPFDENKMMTKGAFAKWRSASDDEIKGGKIPVKLETETFTFTRYIDRASPRFFEACLNSESFASATVVKRVAIDDATMPQAYLQIVFTDVLVIGVDWSDGLLVTEKCDFICRGFKVTYRPQDASGALLENVPAEFVPESHGKLAQKGGG